MTDTTPSRPAEQTDADGYPQNPVCADVGRRWPGGGAHQAAAGLLPAQAGPAAANPPPADEEPVATSDPTADIPTKVIDGRVCTTRAGVAKLAGWPQGNTVNVRATMDPDFPEPVNGPPARGRVGWYPIDGPKGVTAYLAVLAERDAAKKPPPVESGDPAEMLYGADAAAALHITAATLRSYARYSRPYWRGERTDKTPLLPHPDDGDADTPTGQCGWLRGTLTEHQAQRPGEGAGAGRPRKT